MANHYIFIEGVDVTNDITSFDQFTLEVGYNSNKAIVNKLSETFRFESDTETYKMLKSTFFKSCNGFEKELKGHFKSDMCGGVIVPLTVTVEAANYSSKYIEVLMQSDDIDETAYLKFESTYWFDDGFPSAFNIPLIYFAVQPTFLSWMIILLTMPIRSILKSIDAVIRDLCKVVSLGIGKCDIDITGAVFGKLDTWLTGLGRWSTAPLIREILSFHCNITGIQFQSSIINDPDSDYYNLAMFDLSRGEKGTWEDTSREKRIEVMLGNSYLMTVMELVKKMSELYELEYRIIDGTLYIETREFFDRLRTIKVHDADNCTVYSYDLSAMYAYGEFSFSEDGIDREGNKIKSLYSQKLEWNNPPSKAQKGKLTRYHQFAPARFMFDHVSYYDRSFFNWQLTMDDFRDGPEKYIDDIENEGLVRKNDMVISDDLLSLPKLLVLEDNFDRNDAMTIKKEIGRGFLNKPFYIYNYPLMYKEENDSIVNEVLVPGKEGALTGYARNADPRLRKDIMQIKEINVDCNCDIALPIISNFHQVYIGTEFGKGYPENAVIKFEKGKITVTFNDIRVVCN